MRVGEGGTMKLLGFLRRNAPEAPAPDACDLCSRGVPHRVFVTAPPGWGSVMKCSPSTRRNGVVVRTDEEIARLQAERAAR